MDVYISRVHNKFFTHLKQHGKENGNGIVGQHINNIPLTHVFYKKKSYQIQNIKQCYINCSIAMKNAFPVRIKILHSCPTLSTIENLDFNRSVKTCKDGLLSLYLHLHIQCFAHITILSIRLLLFVIELPNKISFIERLISLFKDSFIQWQS